MRSQVKLLVTILSCLLLGHHLKAQVLENYNPQIVYEQSLSLLPASGQDHAELEINLKDYPLSSFEMQFPAASAVFLEDRLWMYTSHDTVFVVSMEEVRRTSGNGPKENVQLRVYNESLSEGDLSIKKGLFEQAGVSTPPKKKPKEVLRTKDPLKDFLILAFVICLGLIALFKVTYPIVFHNALRPASMFADDASDASGEGRAFSLNELFYLLIFSMLMSLFAILWVHFSAVPVLSDYIPKDLNSLLLMWLTGSFIFMILSYFKYFWIKLFSLVYQFDKTDESQFFYLVRGLMLILLILFVLIMGFYLQAYNNMGEIMDYAVYLFLVVYLLGIIRLFYLMIKKVPFKSYHLFSYLCSSELVPFLIIVKLVVG